MTKPRVPPLVDTVAHATQKDARVTSVGLGRVLFVDVVLGVSMALDRGRLCRHDPALDIAA